MATHTSILARRVSWTEDSGGLQSMGVEKSRTCLSHFHFPPSAMWQDSAHLLSPCVSSPAFAGRLDAAQ